MPVTSTAFRKPAACGRACAWAGHRVGRPVGGAQHRSSSGSRQQRQHPAPTPARLDRLHAQRRVLVAHAARGRHADQLGRAQEGFGVRLAVGDVVGSYYCVKKACGFMKLMWTCGMRGEGGMHAAEGGCMQHRAAAGPDAPAPLSQPAPGRRAEGSPSSSPTAARLLVTCARLPPVATATGRPAGGRAMR